MSSFISPNNWKNTNNWYIDLVKQIVSSCVVSLAINKQNQFYNNYPIRILRSDLEETNISFSGNYLNNSYLSNFEKTYTNIITNPEMVEDSNLDGVTDGYIDVQGTGHTTIFSIDNTQKIEITNSGSIAISFLYQDIAATEGDIISLAVDCKILGDITAKVYIDWYNNSTKITTSAVATYTKDYFRTLVNNYLVAPATTTTARFIVGISNNSVGTIGSGWFKNSKFVKDIAALEQFNITKIYDQVNNNNAVQNILSNQILLDTTDNSIDFFDDKYLQISNNTDFEFGNGSFTIELYCKAKAINAATKPIVAYGQANYGNGWLIAQNGTNLYIYLNSTSPTVIVNNVFELNNYVHIIIVCNATANSVKIYIDNILVLTQPSVTWNFVTGEDLYLNKLETTYGDGKLRKINLFSDIVSENDIEKLYKLRTI